MKLWQFALQISILSNSHGFANSDAPISSSAPEGRRDFDAIGRTTKDNSKALKKFLDSSLWLAKFREQKTLDVLKAKSVVAAFARYEQSLATGKPVDVTEIVSLGMSITSTAGFVVGFTVPHLWLLGGAFAVYNVPVVKLTVEQNILGFGEYLVGPQPSYDLAEFNANKVNRPYLVCNYYAADDDIVQGKRPAVWEWARMDDLRLQASSDPFPQVIEAPHSHRGGTRTDAVKELSADSDEDALFNYRGFVVINGRWLRLVGPNNAIMRFATIHSPIRLQEACYNALKRKDAWTSSDGKISTAEYARIIPTVAYSLLTPSYPIYFLQGIFFKDGEQSAQRAVLINDDLSQLKMQKDESTYDDYVSDFLRQSFETTSLAGSRTVIGGYSMGDVWGPSLMAFQDAYGVYTDLKKAHRAGKVLSTSEYAKAAVTTAVVTQSVLKIVSSVAHQQAQSIPYLNAVGLAYYAFNLVGYYGVANVVDKLIEDNSIDENSAGVYQPSDFVPEALSRTYVACQYYEELDKFLKKDQLFWHWLSSNGISEEIYGGDESDRYHELKGRWVRNMKGEYYFATLEDPAKLKIGCLRDIFRRPELIPDKYRERFKEGALNPANSIMTAGNTRISYGYPLLFLVNAQVTSASTKREVLEVFRGDFHKSQELLRFIEKSTTQEEATKALPSP